MGNQTNFIDLEKARYDAQGGAAAYPYDETFDRCTDAELTRWVQEAEGLEKLRAVKDRAMAADLGELYWIAQYNSQDETLLRQQQAAERRREQEELEYYAALAERALSGGLGKDAKEEAEEVILDRSQRGPDGGAAKRTDPASLEECYRRIRKLRSV